MSLRRLTALALVGACAGLPGFSAGSQRPAESPATEFRPQQATSLVRAMHAEILEAQKRTIAKFMALPEADDIRIYFDKNFYSWSVSEKSRATRQEEFETALATYTKDFKDAALVDELRIYAKRVQKNTQDGIGPMEARLGQVQKELREGKFIREGKAVEFTDATRKTWTILLQLLRLELEFKREAVAIAGRYAAKISELSR